MFKVVRFVTGTVKMYDKENPDSENGKPVTYSLPIGKGKTKEVEMKRRYYVHIKENLSFQEAKEIRNANKGSWIAKM